MGLRAAVAGLEQFANLLHHHEAELPGMVEKAKKLVLEVDFGKNYDLGDYCVFADARLVQQ